MEKAKEFLKPNSVEFERVFTDGSDLHVTRGKHCFYEDFALRGIQVDRFETGSVACTFKVPPRLTVRETLNCSFQDRNGNMAPGAIFNLVDEVGAAAAVQFEGQPMLVSVDMSVSFLSTAKVDDELEITAKLLGRKGRCSGTFVILRNKTTGEVVAEGRHSLFGKPISRL
ncbi:hypothetical protein QQ045_019935 [Rhodiola kirilowii]